MTISNAELEVFNVTMKGNIAEEQGSMIYAFNMKKFSVFDSKFMDHSSISVSEEILDGESSIL